MYILYPTYLIENKVDENYKFPVFISFSFFDIADNNSGFP